MDSLLGNFCMPGVEWNVRVLSGRIPLARLGGSDNANVGEGGVGGL